MKSRVPEAGITVSERGSQWGDMRLSLAWMRTGMLALPVSVKANTPEARDVELKAGFQQTAGRPAKEDDQPVVPGR